MCVLRILNPRLDKALEYNNITAMHCQPFFINFYDFFRLFLSNIVLLSIGCGCRFQIIPHYVIGA